jgi:hypothetical protein
MKTQDESLQGVLEAAQAAVRHAYAEGYKQGAKDTTERMMRAAAAGLDVKLPAILGEAEPSQVQRKPPPPGARMSPPRKGLANAPREFQYGSVIGAFRQAILASPDTGITRDELVEFCSRKGLDITRNQYRDTIKRLLGGDEIERRHDAYFPGRRLKREQPAQMNGSSLL